MYRESVIINCPDKVDPTRIRPEFLGMSLVNSGLG